MKIGKCEIPNRLVVPAMVANMCPDRGLASEQYIRYHEEKAKGGFGLIITEDYRINPHAGGYPHIAGLWNEEQVESHKKFTDRIHQYDSKVFCQIYHAGRQATSAVNGGVPVVSCSPIPDPWNKQIPHELTVDEIHQIVKDFGNTAGNVVKAGFDGVEIHCAHGYLLHEFLSPNCNHRLDEYGGSYLNRIRFLHEVYDAVRAAVGPDFPVMIRISAEENTEGGRKFHETRQILKDIESWGVDAIHLSTGMYGVISSLGTVASHHQHHGWTMDFAAEAKKFIKIPIVTVGRISEPCMAEDILAEGKADFISLGRESLTDPHWPEKAKAGKLNDIRHCVGCLQGCTASTYQGVPLYCMINPELGHEWEYDYTPVEKPKKVIVAGGGIAGLEAARAAAIKGHKVDLYEAKDTVGGQFISATYPPYKSDYGDYTAWVYRQVQKYDNITIHLNTELTIDMIKEAAPDKVIIATGAKAFIPELPGIHGANVVLAEDVLVGKADTGMNVVVAGAGTIGVETAAFLGTQCKSKVTMLSKYDTIAKEYDTGIRDDMKHLLDRLFVEIIRGAKIAGANEEGCLMEKDGKVTLIPCDTVVLAIGTRAYNPLEEQVKELGIDCVVVGDAVKARQAIQAISEGFKAGLNA